MENVSQSPSPKKIEVKNEDEKKPNVYEMLFGKAVQELLNKKKITKLEWDNEKIYGFLNDGILFLQKEDGPHQWILSEGDLGGDDWIVIN